MNSKIKHTRWFCYNHTPTTSSLKLWKATTIPLLRNGTKSIGYLLPLERMKGIEPSSPTWKEGVMTIIRHSRFGWNQTRSVHRDLVVDFRQSGTRHFCVLSWIWTMDHLINSQGLYRWAKKTLCREDRIWTCDLLVPNQARYRATLLPYFISHMSKNTTNIQKKTFKNKKPRTFCVQGF